MKIETREVKKYVGASDKLYDTPSGALKSLVIGRLSEIVAIGQVHYDVDHEEQATNLIVNRGEVMELLEAWDKFYHEK